MCVSVNVSVCHAVSDHMHDHLCTSALLCPHASTENSSSFAAALLSTRFMLHTKPLSFSFTVCNLPAQIHSFLLQFSPLLLCCLQHFQPSSPSSSPMLPSSFLASSPQIGYIIILSSCHVFTVRHLYFIGCVHVCVH